MAFCTSCGAAQVSESDRFCRSCGQPNDTLETPPSQPMPSGAPPHPPHPPQLPPAPPAPLVPMVAGDPDRSTVTDEVVGTQQPSGPRLRLLLAVFGTIFAVGLGGLLAWQFLGPRGGAGSPEDAARKLIEAGTKQDPLAVLDVIAPDEVEGFESVIEKAVERAEDEELVGEDQLTDAVEIELTDLEFDVDEVSDDLARVSVVGGDYKVSWDPDKLPDRLSFLRDESDAESESGDISDLLDDGDLADLYVMTVKVDGRWYITALGTIAEYIYDDSEDYYDLARPEYDAVSDDVEPVVGDEPEDVIEGLLETISEGDGSQLLASMPGDLGLPLRPYVAIVEDAMAGRYGGDAVSLDLTVDGLDLETDDIGDGRLKVVVNGGTFSGTAIEDGEYYDSVSIEFDGRCVTGTGEGFATYDYYEEDGYYDEYGEYVYGESYEELISDSQTWCFGNDDELGAATSDVGIDEYFVVMREADGGYQLDPAATASEYGSLALEGLDDAIVDDLIDAWEDQY